MRVTLIDFCEAEGSRKPQGTLAGEGIDSIHTSASIETGALSALVDVVLAVGSLKPRRALAGVAVDIVGARAPIPARLTQTLVGVCLTFIPME